MSALEKYSSYKDSGAECLGKIPEHWEVKKLKYLANLFTGNSISDSKKSKYEYVQEDSFPYISTKDIKYVDSTINYNNGLAIPKRITTFKIAPKNSTLLCIEGGSAGKKIAFLKKDVCFVNKLACISVKNQQPSKYLYYLTKSALFDNQFKLFMNGLIGGVSTSTIKNFYLLEAPKEEQTKIANFLDEKTTQIDEAIKQKEELIGLLKERRQVLIHKAVTQGLDPTVKMKDSGVEWIGEIPENWEIEKVKYIFNLIIDPAPINNKFELLSIYTDIGVKPRKDLAERGNKASTTDGYWKVKKGDFIVNKLLAWMGAVGLSEYDGVTSPAYDILRAIEPIEGVYFHELFRMKVFSQEMKKHSRGIMDMRLRLYFDKFGDIRVPLPPLEEQTEIVKYIKINSDKIEKVISLQEKQINKIQEYKSTLIDSCVTGKVKVPNI